MNKKILITSLFLLAICSFVLISGIIKPLGEDPPGVLANPIHTIINV